MIDPSAELQVAIIAAFKTYSPLKDLIDDKVFDGIPGKDKAKKPYVQLGQPQVLPDKADCIDGAEVHITVHGWAEGPQSLEIKKIGKAIAAALDEQELPLEGHRMVVCLHEQTDYVPDPDGITQHVAVTFLIRTEPT